MQLTEINIYPIKSLKGISVTQSKIESRGLEFDRRWMLIDKNNQFLTQRELPEMATLEIEINEKGLFVKAKGSIMAVPFQPPNNEIANVKIWSSKCRAEIYEDKINEWFSDILKFDCKLALMPEETKRLVNPFYAVNKFKDTVSFADGYPFLLIGENSLNDLNSRLEKPIPMNRFRPNFVFNDSEPFAEDNWKKIKIGNAIFHLVKPCARCVMITIDQGSGTSDGNEPLKTLAGYRLKKRGDQQKILFGQNLIAENVGKILKVGDRIEVIEAKKN